MSKRCLDAHREDCEGPVESQPSLAGTGTLITRCQKHWDARYEQHQEHVAIYPDSPIAPAWFDESAAGERWNDDY